LGRLVLVLIRDTTTQVVNVYAVFVGGGIQNMVLIEKTERREVDL